MPPSNVIETSDISINSPGASLVSPHGLITRSVANSKRFSVLGLIEQLQL